MRPLERTVVLALLLLGAFLRLWTLGATPLGFSAEEMQTLALTETVREGQIQVLYSADRPNEGREGLYPILNALATSGVGDGLIGYRLLSLWLSLLSLALFFGAARGLFGVNVALVGLAMASTNLPTLIFARTVTPAPLSELWANAALAGLVWAYHLYEGVRPFRPETTRFTVLAFILAGALYTHALGLALALAVALYIFYLWRGRQPFSRYVWQSSLYTLSLFLILTLPYLISFIRNPHLSTLALLWREAPTSPLAWLESSVGTLIAIFWRGDLNPTHNVPSLPLLLPLWFVLALVGMGEALRRWRQPSYALPLLWLALGLLPDMWVRGGADFSLLLMSYSPLYLLAGLGAFRAAQTLQRAQIIGGWRWVAALTALGLLWSVGVAGQRLLDEWPQRPDVRRAYQSDLGVLALFYDRQAEAPPTLFCVNTLTGGFGTDGARLYADPQRLEWMRHRERRGARYADCRQTFIFINGGEAMQVFVAEGQTLADNPALARWMEGWQVQNDPRLPLGSWIRVEAVQALAELGGQFSLSTNLIYPEGSIAAPPIRFGRNITLLGVLLDENNSYQVGQPLQMASYWRVDGELSARLGFFLRLHDTPQASPYAEENSLATLPSRLGARDIILHSHRLIPPPTLPEGDYVLTLGAYDNNPLNQLAIFDAQAAQTLGSYLLLSPPLRLLP